MTPSGFAEKEALTTVFPGFRSLSTVFRIVSLAPWFLEIRDRLSGLLPAEAKQDRYIDRVSKRPRL